MNSESDDKEQTEVTPTSAGGEDRVEAKIDRDLRDPFPASDPPGWVLGVERPPAEEEGENDISPSAVTGGSGEG
jgi:hypothetical protein